MDRLQQLQDLRSFGYTVPTKVRRSFGGPFMLEAPDGRIVLEEDFAAELVKRKNERTAACF